jgi:phosphoadenosine phosphosulfate reductase
MRRALSTLGINTWFAGLRRSQAESRAKLNPLEVRDGRFKVHPIFDWSDRDVYLYLKAHGLPYHPLWDQGYVSIGDWHSTKSLSEVSSAEELRFSGLKRECGIHGLEG